VAPNCDGSYECSADEHAEGCLSADLDPTSELSAVVQRAPGEGCPIRPDGECRAPRCVGCPATEPW